MEELTPFVVIWQLRIKVDGKSKMERADVRKLMKKIGM